MAGKRLNSMKKINKQLYAYENFIHDIKTPLTITYSYIQTIENMTITQDDYTAYIFQIKKNWYRILKLIHDASDEKKLDNGNLMPNLRNYDVVMLLKELIESAMPLADRKKINLSFIASTAKIITETDKGLFERIILNLLSNAIKFTDSGKNISLIIKEGYNKFSIIIKDEGSGITPEMLNKIFNRYVYEDSERNQFGTGIGLSIAKELTELLGGKMKIKSELNIGTEVTITLPIKITEEKEDFISYDDFYLNNIVQIELSDDY